MYCIIVARGIHQEKIQKFKHGGDLNFIPSFATNFGLRQSVETLVQISKGRIERLHLKCPALLKYKWKT
jgi:hypothetical protein